MEERRELISDHLGSPLAVWEEGENTSPVLTRKYDSFGNILERSGDLELPFGFAGGTWDEDTGLIRFGVRDYDPEVGRWTSKELLGFTGARKFQTQRRHQRYTRNQRSCNWYSYCDDDPVNYWDLDGEAKDSITASLEAAAASGNYAYIEELLDAGVLIGRHLALAKKLLSMRHSGEACEVPNVVEKESKKSNKEKSTDVDTRAKNNPPNKNENFEDWWKRLKKETTITDREKSKTKKWYNRKWKPYH